MTQSTFALLTTTGRAKEALALASGEPLVISAIAIGDGTTVPSGGEKKLYHEIARKTVSDHGLVAGTTNTAYFDIHLAATDGPYTIREAGLYDAAGDLIAIACYDPPINKPTPESGQTVEGDVRLQIAFSNAENVIVQVDASMQVPLQRLTVKPWVPIKSIDTKQPPENPAPGDVYVIPATASGVWKGQSQKLAEFTSAGWAITGTPDGHGVGLSDGSIYIKIAGVYTLLTDQLDKRYSRLTTPPVEIYYVDATSGSDKNTGTSANNAFKTISGAIAKIRENYLSFKTITVNIAEGIYEGFRIEKSYISSWNFVGAGVDKTKIVADDIDKTIGRGVEINDANVTVSNMSFSAFYEGATVGTRGGTLEINTCFFNMASGAAIGIGNVAGQIAVYGNIKFSGSGRACVSSGGLIRLGFKDAKNERPVAFDWAPGTTVSVGNVAAANGGIVEVFPTVYYQGNAPIGRRFFAELNGVINVARGGVNFFAGSEPGECESGGQYF